MFVSGDASLAVDKRCLQRGILQAQICFMGVHVGGSTTAYSWGLLSKPESQQSAFPAKVEMLTAVNSTCFSMVTFH